MTHSRISLKRYQCPECGEPDGFYNFCGLTDFPAGENGVLLKEIRNL